MPEKNQKREQGGRPPRAPDAGSGTERRILHALRRLSRALDIHSRKLAAEKNVTSAQLFSMKMLAIDNVDTATEVAKRVHLSPSTVVGILDRLEEKELIERRRDTQDRRVVRLRLTRKGRDVVDSTPHPIEDLLTQERNGMTETEAREVADCLEKLVGILGARDLDAETPYGQKPCHDRVDLE